MKIYIDKLHGLHYHKPDCELVKNNLAKTHGGNYEPISCSGKLGFSLITFGDRRYMPCPRCFGEER